MIKIFTNTFISDNAECRISDLPGDLQQDLLNLRSNIVFIFQVPDYRYILIDETSLSVLSKGRMITKLNESLPQPVVKLLNSIIEKAANL